MFHAFYIAWKYIQFHKGKTAILLTCVSLILFLPLALNLLLDESERQLMARAASTPLLIGAKGSSLDLAMNSLYFGDEVPDLMTMAASERVEDSDLAYPIPTYVRFKAREFPIVGTTLDYFEFRKLFIAEGDSLTMLGDCVVGSSVAEKLNLKAGGSLVSSPENFFDLAGVYPLKMKVVGILARSHTPDDLAVFVDLKTAWIIQGLMHGHEDVTRTTDSSVILKRNEKNVAANAKLFQYAEITEENRDSFHYHGDPSKYPITAIIAVPFDDKSGTILRGRYVDRDELQQIIKPDEVIDELLQNIFRIKNVLDAVIVLVSSATALAMVLVFALSLRLRQREIDTIYKLGCRRSTVARLMGAEVFFIVAGSGFICAASLFMVNVMANDLVRMMFIR